jgi:hypothetical protein
MFGSYGGLVGCILKNGNLFFLAVTATDYMGITTRISLEVAVEVSAKRSRIAVATLPSKIQISGKNLRSAPPRSPVIDQDPSQETE